MRSAILLIGVLMLSAGCDAFSSDSSSSASSKQEASSQSPIDADKRDLSTRPGVDWARFLGPTSDGISNETGLNWNWGDGGLKLVWSRRIGEGYGIGSVAAGRIYHFDRSEDRARLVCLNAESGQLLWDFSYHTDYSDLYGFDGGPRASPVIDDGRVFIHGPEGMLHCLDALTGKPIWECDTVEQFGVVQNFFGVGSSPLVYQDLLIVLMGGSPESSQRLPPGRLDQVQSNQSAIVAFDKATGEVKYQTGDDLASYASPIVTSIRERQTGLAFCRANLLAFEPTSGEILWKFPWRARKFESVNASTPVVRDDKILLTESYGKGGVYIDLSTGSPQTLWSDADRPRDRALACHWCTPVVINGFAYACSGESVRDAELRCVELATGQIKWSEPGLGRTSLMGVDGHLICLSEKGQLFAIKANPNRLERVSQYDPSGEEFKLVSPCWAAPIVSHGLLYVRDRLRLICFDISRGNESEN